MLVATVTEYITYLQIVPLLFCTKTLLLSI